VEDRWHNIEDREKLKVSNPYDIRIRDPANSEIPIAVTGVERSIRTCASEFRHVGYRESKNQVFDIMSCETTIGEVLIDREKSTLTGHRVSGIREPSDRQ
jgi:hypothetical protein